MKHQAILNLYQAATVSELEDGSFVVLDSQGGRVTIDDAAVTAEAFRLQAEYDATEYQRKRAAEYPPMADYLDAVVKGDQAQIDAYVAACLAVKAKYPKEQA
jgi:hypothetical protein